MAARILFAALTLSSLAAVDPPQAGETVVLRASDGRFLSAAADGSLRPGGFCPDAEGRFELVELPDDRIALRASSGRFLTLAAEDGRRTLATGPEETPGSAESFSLAAVEGNRGKLTSCSTGLPVHLDGKSETVEVFTCRDLPGMIQTALGLAIRGVVKKELGAKEYSKVTTHNVNRYITLPAPTLKNPRRKKRHQILGVPEEYHVRARLTQEPEVAIDRMPSLTGYLDPADRRILFSLEARLPIEGSVSYKVPKLLSATTNYRVTVVLALDGEMCIRKEDDQLSLTAPELRRINVTMHGLDLANDVLQTMRGPIERTINGELRKNEAKIRNEANKQIAKAAGGKEFRHPLFRFLGVP